jgi:hypothetical protein
MGYGGRMNGHEQDNVSPTLFNVIELRLLKRPMHIKILKEMTGEK